MIVFGHFVYIAHQNHTKTKTTPFNTYYCLTIFFISQLYDKVPSKFNTKFKNPCWHDEVSQKLWCLPYFYQIGMPKCGTTDLWDKLVQHPQVQNVPKEPHWWSKRRNGWTKTPIHQAQGIKANLYICHMANSYL